MEEVDGGTTRSMLSAELSDLCRHCAATGAAISILDAQGRYIFVTPEFSALFGYEAGTITGQSFSILIPHDERAKETEWFRHLAATGESRKCTVRRVCKSGRCVPVCVTAGRFVDRSANAFVILTYTDVSETVRTRRDYERLFNSCPDILCIVNLDGLAHRISPALATVLGYEPSEITALRFIDIVHPEHIADSRAALDKLRRGEKLTTFSNRCRCRDGSWKWIEWNAVPAEDRRSAFAVGRDITGSQEFEEKLQNTQRLLSGVLKSSLIGVMAFRAVRNENGKIVDFTLEVVNPAAARLFGKAEEEFAGKSLLKEFPFVRKRGFFDLDVRVVETGEPYEHEYCSTHNGRRFWIHAVVVPWEDGFAVTFSDITQRKEAEDALRQSEERYRDLVENASEALFVRDLDGKFLSVNKAAERVSGYPRQELLKMNMYGLVAPEWRDVVRQTRSELLSGIDPVEREFAIITKDRQRVWLEVSERLLYRDGKPAGVQGIARNISDKKQFAVALRESEEKYRRIVETAEEGILITNNEHRTTFVNQKAAEMLGYTQDEMLGRELLDFIHEDARSTVIASLQRREHGQKEQYDVKLRRKDGTEVWTIVSSNPYQDKHGVYVGALAMLTDISERKVLEEKLLQTQRIESIGRLAGGVAHDFNNLLTVINGYAELLLMRLPKSDPIAKQVQEIRKAGERAASLTQQLLAFSRRQVLQPKILSLNAQISELEKMLRRLIGEDIGLTTALDRNLVKVKADPGQFEQVIMNLAVNARDAMPEGGRLSIETQNVTVGPENGKQYQGVAYGTYAAVIVSDTGVGMTEAVMAKMFEPFFTTKERGKGTGLGLSTVYGIISQSGGYVLVQSELGNGSTFTVLLPQTGETAAQCETAVEVDVPQKGTETVLLVEDQQEVRELSCTILKSYGYKVLPAANGGEALLLCERHSGPIDLMMTDVVMPGMTGHELAARLRGVRPEMKVLYMSGYADNVLAEKLESQTLILQKPFAPVVLAKRVREALDNGRERVRILVVEPEDGLRQEQREVLEGAGYHVIEATQAVSQFSGGDVDIVVADLEAEDVESYEIIRELKTRHPDLKVIATSGRGPGLENVLTMVEKPLRPKTLLAAVQRLLS